MIIYSQIREYGIVKLGKNRTVIMRIEILILLMKNQIIWIQLK